MCEHLASETTHDERPTMNQKAAGKSGGLLVHRESFVVVDGKCRAFAVELMEGTRSRVPLNEDAADTAAFPLPRSPFTLIGAGTLWANLWVYRLSFIVSDAKCCCIYF